LAAGYLIRLRQQNTGHRLIQQFTIVRPYPSFRLAHRIAADQTFRDSEDVELRFRYRIATDFSLSGQKVDRREFYAKISNEYLNALQEGDYDLEVRLVSLLGFAFNDNNKLEGGIDYRLDGFIRNAGRSSFWFVVNWYVSL
jgi:hypothetical protein